jgi:hypothetical protein
MIPPHAARQSGLSGRATPLVCDRRKRRAPRTLASQVYRDCQIQVTPSVLRLPCRGSDGVRAARLKRQRGSGLTRAWRRGQTVSLQLRSARGRVSGEAPGASSTRQPGSVSATISASWRICSFSVVEPMLNAWSCARVAGGRRGRRGRLGRCPGRGRWIEPRWLIMKVRFRSRSQRVFRKRREIHHRVDPVQVTERDVADGASDSRDVGDGRLVSELTAPVGDRCPHHRPCGRLRGISD